MEKTAGARVFSISPIESSVIACIFELLFDMRWRKYKKACFTDRFENFLAI